MGSYITCARCGREKQYNTGRNLCRTCRRWVNEHSNIEDYPLLKRPTTLDRIEDYNFLRDSGLSEWEIAKKLSVKYESLQRFAIRHGLRRAEPKGHVCNPNGACLCWTVRGART